MCAPWGVEMAETSAVDRESILALDPKMEMPVLSTPLDLYLALSRMQVTRWECPQEVRPILT
jgi:hypothetical protein